MLPGLARGGNNRLW